MTDSNRSDAHRANRLECSGDLLLGKARDTSSNSCLSRRPGSRRTQGMLRYLPIKHCAPPRRADVARPKQSIRDIKLGAGLANCCPVMIVMRVAKAEQEGKHAMSNIHMS